MVWYNFCENIHKFHNSLKKNTTNSLSLSHQDSYNFLTMWQKKMKHIKSPEKKISTKVLFMTLYHTAIDNSQSNQHQLSKIRKIWLCYKYILTKKSNVFSGRPHIIITCCIQGCKSSMKQCVMLWRSMFAPFFFF